MSHYLMLHPLHANRFIRRIDENTLLEFLPGQATEVAAEHLPAFMNSNGSDTVIGSTLHVADVSEVGRPKIDTEATDALRASLLEGTKPPAPKVVKDIPKKSSKGGGRGQSKKTDASPPAEPNKDPSSVASDVVNG